MVSASKLSSNEELFLVGRLGFKLLVLLLINLCLTIKTFAQVPISDRTLKTKVDSIDESTFIVEGGHQLGKNLFHSFENFSVPQNKSIIFNNNSKVQNIFSRVTGNKFSQIDGAIRSNGSSNFFLINPNGINFGEYASLDLGGHFIGSTANHVLFSDGSLFGINEDTQSTAPILKISQPIGLQFSKNKAAPIKISSGKTNLLGERIGGLRIDSGKTLAFVGGNVNLYGGNLIENPLFNNSKSRFELGGLSNPGIVKIEQEEVSLSLIFPDKYNLADIAFYENSFINSGGGDISLNGKNISFLNSTLTTGIRIPSFDAGTININAQENINVNNSLIVVGQGLEKSSISIDSKSLMLIGSSISTAAIDQVQTGNINIKTDDDITLVNSDINSSLIFSQSVPFYNTARTGNIEILANNLNLVEDSRLSTGTFQLIGQPSLFFSFVDSGNIKINILETANIINSFIFTATAGFVSNNEENGLIFPNSVVAIGDVGDITLNAGTLFLSEGSLTSGSAGIGKSGDIEVNATKDIILQNGSGIDSGHLGSGDAGRISLEAGGDILLEGTKTINSVSEFPGLVAPQLLELPFESPSIISSPQLGPPQAEGNSKGVDIRAKFLSLDDGAFISTGTNISGDAGDITIITSDTVSLSNDSFLDASVFTSGVGDGGEIDIQAKSLSISQGAFISSNLAGGVDFLGTPGARGDGGNIIVNASESITLSGISSEDGVLVLPTAILASSDPGTIGSTGNISLITNTLQISDGAIISIQKENDGDSGIISINSNTLQAINGGQIIANTRSDNEASVTNINLNISELIDLRGVDFNFDNRQRQVNNRIIETNSGAASGIFARNLSDSAANGGNINISNLKVLNITDGATISALTEGFGNAGNVNVDSDLILLRNQGEISTQANDQSMGGNITIEARFLAGAGNSDIIANAFAGQGGNITITADSIFGLRPRVELTSLNDINASSQLGIDGTTNIDALIDPGQDLAKVPEDIPDISNSIAQGCVRLPSTGRLNVIGREGSNPIPVEPLDADDIPMQPLMLPINQENLDLRPQLLDTELTLRAPTQTTKIDIFEAQKAIITSNGTIALIAQPRTNTLEILHQGEACRVQAAS